jgi:hypothetical protein
MRHQWYDPAREASSSEPRFVCDGMAQELADTIHVGKDRSTLCATVGKAA